MQGPPRVPWPDGEGVLWLMPEASVLIVRSEPERVECDLALGVVGCPSCGGVLGGWGFARWRVLRCEAGPVALPRRARCRSCRSTHVLLPDVALVRRVDAVAVIGAALTHAAAGALGIARRPGGWAARCRRWWRAAAAGFRVSVARWWCLRGAGLPGDRRRPGHAGLFALVADAARIGVPGCVVAGPGRRPPLVALAWSVVRRRAAGGSVAGSCRLQPAAPTASHANPINARPTDVRACRVAHDATVCESDSRARAADHGVAGSTRRAIRSSRVSARCKSTSWSAEAFRHLTRVAPNPAVLLPQLRPLVVGVECGRAQVFDQCAYSIVAGADPSTAISTTASPAFRRRAGRGCARQHGRGPANTTASIPAPRSVRAAVNPASLAPTTATSTSRSIVPPRPAGHETWRCPTRTARDHRGG